MLKTPFGNIRMFLDKKEVEFNFFKIQNSKSFLKTETYSLKYEFKKEKVDKTSKHFLKCILENSLERKIMLTRKYGLLLRKTVFCFEYKNE